MAVFETVIRSDLQKPLTVQKLSGYMFSADNQGNKISVDVFDGGSPASLSGGVSGYVVRADGATVVISGNTYTSLSGNRASIILPASAYVVVGVVSIVIKVGTTTVGACSGYVYRTSTDEIVDPGHVIPSIEELLAKIADCEAATEAANTAASSANTAASSANSAASSATTAAGSANTAASSANSAASSATSAAGAANTAAGKIDNMTVAASGLAAGSSPTATVSEVSGHKHIAFGIPKGDKGDTGTTPDISIGTVTTLNAGDPATASMTGTPEAPVLNLGIPKGYDATIKTQTDYYQESSSGSAIPTGTWSTTIPSVTQGNYLWIKHHIVWYDDVETDVYSVSRQGVDGNGSVNSIKLSTQTLSPDSSGMVTLPLDNSPTAGSTNLMTSGDINTQIAGLSARIDALDPEQGSAIFTDVAFSIASDAWTLANSLYTYQYNNVLITAGSGVEVFYDSTLRSALTGDIYITKNTGSVTFTTTKAPIGTLTGTLRVIVSVSGTLPVAKGGTGATTAKGARANLNVSERPIPISFGTVSSLPQTVYDADITADMIPSQWVYGTPSACPSGLKCTTAAGSVTISLGTGQTFSGSTTVDLWLVNPRSHADDSAGQQSEQYAGNYVQIGAQSLTAAQKTQVQTNIGAASASELVSKRVVTSLSESYTGGWADDFLDLPTVSNHRSLFTIYSASAGRFFMGMKRANDQKIAIQEMGGTSPTIGNDTELFVSGIFK